MAHIVVVDAHTFSLRLISRAVALGHRVTFVTQATFQWYEDTEENRSAIGFAERVFILPALTQEDDLTDLMARIDAELRIDAVLCVVDPSIEATSVACARLSIPFTNAAGVSNARRKSRARAIITAAGLASANFGFAADISGVDSALQKLKYPLVVKPESAFSGLLCQRAGNRREALQAARAIHEAANAVPPPLREQFTRGIMVEEVLDGRLVSAEIGVLDQFSYRLALTGRNLPDVEGYFDLGGAIPADVSALEAEACFKYAERVCKVLGLDLGVFHVEIMITAHGPILIEVNPRVMGGIMMIAYECATGADICDYIIDLHLRRKPSEPLPTVRRAATVRKIMPRNNSTTASRLDLSWLKSEIDVIVDGSTRAIRPNVPIERLQTLGRFIVCADSLSDANDHAEQLLDRLEMALGFALVRPRGTHRRRAGQAQRATQEPRSRTREFRLSTDRSHL